MDDGLAHAAAQVGDRWTLLIVATLLPGPQRFTDLADALDGIGPNTLSSRLSDLEHAGLVVSTPYQQRPERFSYDLTDAGRDLRDVVTALQAWQARRGDGSPPRHATCGTELELAWWCPDCRRAVAAPDEDASWV